MSKQHLNFDLDFLDSDGKKTETPKAKPHYHKEVFPSRRKIFSSDTQTHVYTSHQHSSTSSSDWLSRLTAWFSKKTRVEKRNVIIGVVVGVAILVTSIIIGSTPDTSIKSNTSSYSNGSSYSNIPVSNSPDTKQYDENSIFTDENGKTFSCSLTNHSTAQSLRPSDSEKNKIIIDKNYLDSSYAQIENLKSEIDSMYVNEYSSQYLINEYNDKIDDYNAKVATYKRNLNNHNAEVDSYNLKVDKYNNFLRNNCTPI